MTEAEWLDLDDPHPRQLAAIHEVASARKILLLAAAFVRGVRRHPENAGAKRCDDLIEAAADRPRPWAVVEAELEARPGHWGFAHVLHEVGAERVAIALRTVMMMRPGDPAWSVRDIVRLVHEVAGNPFRPAAADPSWLTSVVLGMASGMYESRDFSSMPILADALQDAGCDDDEVLAHCRNPNKVHVRGCWVIDLVLGKE